MGFPRIGSLARLPVLPEKRDDLSAREHARPARSRVSGPCAVGRPPRCAASGRLFDRGPTGSARQRIPFTDRVGFHLVSEAPDLLEIGASREGNDEDRQQEPLLHQTGSVLDVHRLETRDRAAMRRAEAMPSTWERTRRIHNPGRTTRGTSNGARRAGRLDPERSTPAVGTDGVRSGRRISFDAAACRRFRTEPVVREREQAPAVQSALCPRIARVCGSIATPAGAVR